MNERDEHPLATRLRLAKLFADLFFLGVGSFVLVATFEQGGHALETEGLIVAAFFAGVTWLLESRFIRSIEVSQDELTFRARSRTIAVPWPILRSVTVAGRNRIRWRWDGDSVTTPSDRRNSNLKPPSGTKDLKTSSTRCGSKRLMWRWKSSSSPRGLPGGPLRGRGVRYSLSTGGRRDWSWD
ncbi:MAG TPA: hypothetical protein VGK51_00875, partial [Actinomycetota bacterium]